MTEIYAEIAKLSDKFTTMAYGLTTDKNKIDKALEDSELTWYDKKVFELYYSGETLDSLAAKTRISRNSLFTTIDKVRTILKKKLNEDN